ncbi:MAG: signal recognition particle protein [Acidobacteria bacterium]|nr:signal recognition particle protein [Acidobacteriota bacterium]
MFEALSERLEGVFRRLRGLGRVTEAHADEVLREVRLALLEADVHSQVVREFVGRVRERAVGVEVSRALNPGQQVVKIVFEELTAILGSKAVPLRVAPKPPTVIMLAGLQGSGKTTAAAKLALHLKGKGKQPLLVAADMRRPAAVEQLVLLGRQAGVPVVAREGMGAVEVAREGMREAERLARDVVVVDTAGRLHVDEEMMAEAAAIRDAVRPIETLLVCDAMTGQDAVNVATAFLDRVDYTGIVLTKLDGDARGGAALSIAHVSGRPVKFASQGEGLDTLETFHPDRMAQRILGMGDMLTLIEKAESAFEEDERARMEEKLLKASFTLEDFLEQMRGLRKMGPLQSLLGMIPGAGAQLKGLEIDERDLGRAEAIICSMTPAERRDPSIIGGGRRARISLGSGTSTGDVNGLVRQFDQARKMMRAMTGGGIPGVPALKGPGGQAGRARAKDRHKPGKQHGKGKKRRR